MDEEELQELLRYLQARVRAVGLTDLDAAVIEDLRYDDAGPRQQVLAYLEALDTELAVRSRSTVQATVERLNRVASDGSDRIRRVVVTFEGVDETLADSDRVDLLELPDLEPLRQEVGMLVSELRGQIGLSD